MHYLSTSAPCDNNSAPFHLSYLLAPTSVIPPPPRGRYSPLCEPLLSTVYCQCVAGVICFMLSN